MLKVQPKYSKKNRHKSFTNISVFSEILNAGHGLCNHDLRKKIKIIV